MNVINLDGCCFLVWRPASGGTVEIFDLCVCGKHRRQGRGKRMVEELLGSLPVEVRRVWAITRAANFIAQQFYESMRFRSIPLRDFYGEGGVDAVMYVHDVPQCNGVNEWCPKHGYNHSKPGDAV